MNIVVCMKWVPRRVVVDPATATFELDPRTYGPSPADLAALEVALSLATDDDDTVTVVCAGPPAADAMLRDALAMGADRAVRCPAVGEPASAAVAETLAGLCIDVELVLCGDHSIDRGSGSVPAFMAAELEVAQALGVVGMHQAIDLDGAAGSAQLIVERRLDRGRRARLAVGYPAVVSVEGSVALDDRAVAIRRAPLSGVMAATTAPIEIGPTVRDHLRLTTSATRPFRPRTKVKPAPSQAPAHVRILDITKATEQREPPKTLYLDPADAATATIEALRAWGYLGDDTDRVDPSAT